MFVYRFLDVYGKVIYVGRTNNVVRRIRNEHFTSRGHLPEECYRESVQVEYAEVKSESESKFYELYYMEKYQPKYNKRDLGGGRITFPVPELVWKEYAPHQRSNTRGITKKELEQVIETFSLAVEEEITYMNTFLRGKDNVTWLSKLDTDEQNEYIRIIYMMERFVNGLGEIKETSLKGLGK